MTGEAVARLFPKEKKAPPDRLSAKENGRRTGGAREKERYNHYTANRHYTPYNGFEETRI